MPLHSCFGTHQPQHTRSPMPELPEVETTRLGLVHAICHARIEHIQLGKPLRWPLGCEPEALPGLCVQNVRRRSKYLLFDLFVDRHANANANANACAGRATDTSSAGILIIHLGMSGSLRFEPATQPAHAAVSHNPPAPHEHFTMHTTRGVLRLTDPRRFGAVVYAPLGERDPSARKLLDHLGPEPLSADFTPARLHRSLRGRRAAIKQVIMDARTVVGVGNIYASEALFHARIRPDTPAGRIGITRATRLHAAIVKVLTAALRAGGSSLRNYSAADGKAGYFQLQTKVYARAGQACATCGTTIRMLRLGQRSCFFCPVCQKR